MNKFPFANIEKNFDNHISKSIRGYDQLHDDVIKLSRYFVQDGTNVYDVGCSTGKTIRKIIETNKDRKCFYAGLEPCKDFKLPDFDTVNGIRFFSQTLETFALYDCSFITALFTFQFIPYKMKSQQLKSIHNGLIEGGGFVIAEKVLAETPALQDTFNSIYHEYKLDNFSQADIFKKEQDLRGLLYLNKQSELEAMLRVAGFTNIQPFWQNHMFVGLLCVK